MTTRALVNTKTMVIYQSLQDFFNLPNDREAKIFFETLREVLYMTSLQQVFDPKNISFRLEYNPKDGLTNKRIDWQ